MQGKQLRQLEAELWKAADQLRANSKLTATEYSMPVLGLIFLRHAYNRFRDASQTIEQTLPVHPQRGRREVNKQDFAQQNALFLPEKSRFDYLVNLPEKESPGEAIDTAMRLIEESHENLRGVLPKNYSIFSDELLRELLRIFNKEVLRKAEGDLFGKIYEYFLNKFAMTGAQEGGEFFTPMSLVQTIVNVIEPDHGIVFDPACGSAGMFVQTGYFIEKKGARVAEKVTFLGQEKADMNTRLAKMNLAVHGLEGNIQEGNTFYEDKHHLLHKADFVMANPPFNVDGVSKDKDSVKKDPRLIIEAADEATGNTGSKIVNLPKNDNANYLWIQYFYNYLKPTGRAGFVMASSASDAGHSEKDIRRKLIQTGAVDLMIAIGNNFFYTRSLPCTLWFFDRAKENNPQRQNHVLMLDARKIYRKVTTKINDFSPEQLQNLICIVNLYRGNTRKLSETINAYLTQSADAARHAARALADLQAQYRKICHAVLAFIQKYAEETPEAIPYADTFHFEEEALVTQHQDSLIQSAREATPCFDTLQPIADQCKQLRKPQDKLLKQLTDAILAVQKDFQLTKNKDWKSLNIKEELDQLKALQLLLSGNPDEEEPGLLHDARYYWKQAQWLKVRFPEGTYRDIEGLCKIVTREEIAEKDYSLSPGRYVGVDNTTDEEIDFEERLKEIHIELEGLNEEAESLMKMIMENYRGIKV